MDKIKISTIKLIYKSLLRTNGFATNLNSVKVDCIYFALSPYEPKRGFKSTIRYFYSILELWFPSTCLFSISFLEKIRLNKIININFYKLKSEKINYNKNAPIAIKEGASFAIVDTRKYKGDQYIYVPNVRNAFEEIASYHRRNLDIISIGITGSCGKTTTKDLLASVLSQKAPTHKTKDSYNTVIGTCSTVLSIKENIKYLVAEISSAGLGVVRRKCQIAHTNIGLITCIGKAHLEGFGDQDGVIKVKRQLFDYIAEQEGVFFANIDDPKIVEIVGNYANVCTYGQNPSAYIYGGIIKNKPFLGVRWHLPVDLHEKNQLRHLDIQTNLFGTYNISNVLASIAVGVFLGVSPEDIRDGIEAYVPSSLRSQVLSLGNITFILDAYNANPTSMNAALNDFGNLEAPRKIAILGDMLELGQHSKKEHSDIVRKLSGMELDGLYLVGEEFGKAGGAKIAQCFRSTGDLKQLLSSETLSNAVVLVKGSRGIGLEKILDKFHSDR